MLELGKQIGFPLLVKAVKGGGGKGMKLATSAAELPVGFANLVQSRHARHPLCNPEFVNQLPLLTSALLPQLPS